MSYVLSFCICGLLSVLYPHWTEANDYYEANGDSRTYYDWNTQNRSVEEEHCTPLSRFWVRKIRTYFHRRDSNGDGILTKEDYTRSAYRFASTANASLKNTEGIRRKLCEVFADYASFAGKDGRVTEDVVLEVFKTQRNKRLCPHSIPYIFKGVIDYSFPILDTNSNGVLSEREHTRLFYAMGFNHFMEIGKYSFHGIDRNHDGSLTLAEYGVAVHEFFYYEDEKAPGTMFFGPLD